MSSILTILHNNPEMMARAIALADVFNDDKNTAAKRMLAAVQLSDLAAEASLACTLSELVEANRQSESKPKFKFVNGAKVRVKE